MKTRRRNLHKLRPVECPACRKVPKCMRHPCLTSKRYYIVECRPYCGRTAGGYTPKQAIDEWNRRIAYELRI